MVRQARMTFRAMLRGIARRWGHQLAEALLDIPLRRFLEWLPPAETRSPRVKPAAPAKPARKRRPPARPKPRFDAAALAPFNDCFGIVATARQPAPAEDVRAARQPRAHQEALREQVVPPEPVVPPEAAAEATAEDVRAARRARIAALAAKRTPTVLPAPKAKRGPKPKAARVVPWLQPRTPEAEPVDEAAPEAAPDVMLENLDAEDPAELPDDLGGE